MLGASLAIAFAFCAGAQAQNRLESVQANSLGGNKVEVTLKLSEAAPTPLTFTVDNPARIALDLPDTSVAMNSRRVDVKQGVLDTVNVAEANGRTRVVLNVDSLVPYETRVQGDTIVVSLAAATSAATSRPLQTSSNGLRRRQPRSLRPRRYRALAASATLIFDAGPMVRGG